MRKYNEAFGHAIEEIMRERGLSNRGVMIKTRGDVDYGTVQNMRKGIVPKKGIVIDFAVALEEPINKWLILAGYDPLPIEYACDLTPLHVAEDITLYTVPGLDIPEEAKETLREVFRKGRRREKESGG